MDDPLEIFEADVHRIARDREHYDGHRVVPRVGLTPDVAFAFIKVAKELRYLISLGMVTDQSSTATVKTLLDLLPKEPAG
jgi:hypothetical protein